MIEPTIKNAKNYTKNRVEKSKLALAKASIL